MACNITDCSLYNLIKILGKKYITFILITLIDQPSRFSELEKEFSYLNKSQLSRCLNYLILEDLIIKNDDKYTLTNYGKDVTKILLQLDTIATIKDNI